MIPIWYRFLIPVDTVIDIAILNYVDEANLLQYSVNSPMRTSMPSNQTSTTITSKKWKSMECEEMRNALDEVTNAVIKLVESINPLESFDFKSWWSCNFASSYATGYAKASSWLSY